jgi:hypothetical protein
MGAFDGQKPISEAVPNLEALLLNPHTVLARERIVLAPVSVFHAAMIWGTIIVSCLFFLACVSGGYVNPWPWAVFAIPAVMLAISFWVLFMNRGARLVLDRDGVEFHYWSASVWCPWALFNVRGAPLLHLMQWHVSIPINMEALPFVELRKDETCVAYGAFARISSVFVPNPQAGIVLVRFVPKTALAAVANLLLTLSRQLGTVPVARSRPPESEVADQTPTFQSAAELNGDWVTVSVTRICFPPVCCVCGSTTESRVTVGAADDSWRRWITIVLTVGHMHGEEILVHVPVCAECQEQQKRRERLARTRGIWIGAGLGPALGLLLDAFFPVGKLPAFLIMLGFFALFGGLLGAGAGHLLAGSVLSCVSGARYSRRRQTVSLRFRRAGYAEEVYKSVRANEESTRQSK